MAPDSSEYLPISHWMHASLECALASWYLPAWHLGRVGVRLTVWFARGRAVEGGRWRAALQLSKRRSFCVQRKRRRGATSRRRPTATSTGSSTAGGGTRRDG